MMFYDLSGNPFHPYGGPAASIRTRTTDGEERSTFLDENMEKVLEPKFGYAEKVVDTSTDKVRYYDGKGKPVKPKTSE